MAGWSADLTWDNFRLPVIRPLSQIDPGCGRMGFHLLQKTIRGRVTSKPYAIKQARSVLVLVQHPRSACDRPLSQYGHVRWPAAMYD